MERAVLPAPGMPLPPWHGQDTQTKDVNVCANRLAGRGDDHAGRCHLQCRLTDANLRQEMARDTVLEVPAALIFYSFSDIFGEYVA